MKKLFLNFIYVGLSRLVDFGIPLIIFPYLVSTVGKHNYGLYAYAYSLIVYMLNVVQYGFSLSAVREVSENREDKLVLGKIFSRTVSAQLYLLIVCFIVLIVLVLSVPQFREEYILYFSLFLLVIGDCMLCYWYYRGIEKMKFITLVNTISKLTYFLLALAVIHDIGDYKYIGLCQAAGFVISGCVSLLLIVKKEKIHFTILPFSKVIPVLKSGASSFITLFIPTLYSNTSMFLLGALGTPIGVTYFDGANKICRAFSSINTILNQVIYPYAVKNKERSKFKSIGLFYNGTGLLLTLTMLFTVNLTTGILMPDTPEIILPAAILSLSPLLLSIRSTYGINYLMVHHYDSLYMKIALISSLGGFCIAFILIPYLNEVGAAITVIASQTCYALFSYLAYRKISRTVIS